MGFTVMDDAPKKAEPVFLWKREPVAHTIDLTDGGLSSCSVCRGAEGSLPTECPGVRMHPCEEQRVYAGALDFRDGRWQVQKPGLGALVIRMTATHLPGMSVGVDPWIDPIADRGEAA